MFSRTLVGLWAMCVCLTPHLAIAATTDVVLYATDASTLQGNWSLVADPTAASGRALVSVDRQWSNTAAPLASPDHYVDFVFKAPAATPFHIWLRMRAAGDSKYNDSVFAQFSDATMGGVPVFGVGTTSGLTVNLAEDATAAGVSAWGWQDGAYWLAQPATITFASDGSHTLRIQTREDGVSIDQVVLSPATYLTERPGPLGGDTTIVPKPAAGLPTPWASRDVGWTGLPGAAAFVGGVFTISGAGPNIWGTSDGFQFVFQPRHGDGQIVARVTSLEDVNTFAKAGLMFRDTLDAASAHVVLDVRPNGSIEFMSRTAAGAETTFIAGATQAFPTWLRLTRVADTFTGEVSADGHAWQIVGSASVALAADVTTGLAVTSIDTARLDTATFDGVALTTAAPPVDITMTAADAANLHGNWTLVADPTAPAGQSLTSADRGWATTAAALAAPADYLDFTFTAPAATPYHVWLLMRAADGSKYNDSVFAQFTDAVDGTGAGVFPIGTTAALTVNLATDATGAGLSGWGWQDGAYWLTQATTVRFATNGSHTLRIQTREDGVSIAEVLLSPGTCLMSAPVVPVVSVAPPAGSGSTGVPTAYDAIADRNAYPKPPLPQLGAAGFAFADPTFGSSMLRVTDGQTRPGFVNRSFRVPSNPRLTAWNATSTAFYVVSNDGTVIPYSFDPATMTASRIQPANTGNGGLTLDFYVEPQFSLVNPNIIYGVASGSNNRTISAYDFDAHAYSTIVNLDTLVGGLAGTYVGGLMTGGTPSEHLIAFFGGTGQDGHYYALWAPVGDIGGGKLLNTVASTINGVALGAVLNFHLHSVQIDKSGRFVLLYPSAAELGPPRYASQVYVWDTASDRVTPITSGGSDGGVAMHSGGHDAAGYGTWINQDCCTSSSWDAAQWQFRSLTALSQTSDLIQPVQFPKEVYLADHTSWNNAQPSTLVPVISSTYRYGNNTAPWRAWDDEIIGIDTTGGTGGIVWRFAHHRSLVANDADPTVPYFWYEPIANVSPDGKWVLFTSNWEKTLGTDSAEGTFRQDVFLVRLTPRP